MEDVKPSIYRQAAGQDDETLAIKEGFDARNIWAVRIPNYLMEKWEQITEQGVELGTLVVDQSVKPTRITLRMPEGSTAREGDTGSIDEYEVDIPLDQDMNHARATNSFIFTEHDRPWVPREGNFLGKRKRAKAHPTLYGKVAHDATLRPVMGAKYRKIVSQRGIEQGQSRKPIIRLEDTGLSLGKLNQLAGGYANATSTLGKGMVALQKSQQGEKRARLERTELIDRIFSLFREKPYWSFTNLKNELEQPDAWLREIMSELAEQIPEGTYANLWRLKSEWQEIMDTKDGVKDEDGEASAGENDDADDNDEDDDDDDDDMEEVGM